MDRYGLEQRLQKVVRTVLHVTDRSQDPPGMVIHDALYINPLQFPFLIRNLEKVTGVCLKQVTGIISNEGLSDPFFTDNGISQTVDIYKSSDCINADSPFCQDAFILKPAVELRAPDLRDLLDDLHDPDHDSQCQRAAAAQVTARHCPQAVCPVCPVLADPSFQCLNAVLTVSPVRKLEGAA